MFSFSHVGLSLNIYTEYRKLNMKLKILLLVVFIYYHKRAMLIFSGFWKTNRKTATMPSSCQFISKSFCVIYLGGLLTCKNIFFSPESTVHIMHGLSTTIAAFLTSQDTEAFFPPPELCILSFTSPYCPALSRECSPDTVSWLSFQNWAEKGELSIIT